MDTSTIWECARDKSVLTTLHCLNERDRSHISLANPGHMTALHKDSTKKR